MGLQRRLGVVRDERRSGYGGVRRVKVDIGAIAGVRNGSGRRRGGGEHVWCVRLWLWLHLRLEKHRTGAAGGA